MLQDTSRRRSVYPNTYLSQELDQAWIADYVAHEQCFSVLTFGLGATPQVATGMGGGKRTTFCYRRGLSARSAQLSK